MGRYFRGDRHIRVECPLSTQTCCPITTYCGHSMVVDERARGVHSLFGTLRSAHAVAIHDAKAAN